MMQASEIAAAAAFRPRFRLPAEGSSTRWDIRFQIGLHDLAPGKKKQLNYHYSCKILLF
jgi:hypothetical protein